VVAAGQQDLQHQMDVAASVVAVNILAAAAELDPGDSSTRPTITGLNVLPSSEYRSGSDLDSCLIPPEVSI
jgi:hypothetical protein